MPRLSVSLDSEQVEWIEEKKREMGVSKGKVIRECIDEARTGESLLTTPVQNAESGDWNRLATLESRLESLEQTLQRSTITAPTEGVKASDPSATQADSPSSSRQVQRDVAETRDVATDVTQPTDSAADVSESSGEHTDDSMSLPSSVMGDLDTAQSPQQTDSNDPIEDSPAFSAESEAAAGDDVTSAGSPVSTGTGPDSATEVDGTHRDATELGSSVEHPPNQDQSPSPSPSAEDASETPSSPSASAGTPSNEGPVPSRAEASSSNPPAESQSAPAEEVETYDVDKSNPSAVQERLQAELDASDHATAVFACWKRLRDRGTLHTRAMQGLYEDYPLGHSDAREWWDESIKPELAKVPGVQPPEGGGKLYRFSY